MKVRNGFVSNSSSSSFIIGCKGELTKETLMDIFKVPIESPIYKIVLDIARCMVKNAEKLDIAEELKDYGEDSSYGENIKFMIKNDMNMYRGYAADDNGEVEAMLCNMDIHFKSDELFIDKDGGY
jgi:hypothetical protein